MPRKKSKRGGVAFGFVLTVGILSLITLVLLESNGGPGVTVEQIPDKLPTYMGFLQRYVPNNALQVSFDNLTAIRAVNQSVISSQQFFELDQPQVSLSTTAIGWRLTVALSNPNATVTVVTLDSGSFENLSATLTRAGADSIIPTNRVGNVTVYAAAGKLAGEVQAYWLTAIPVDQTLVYSSGANDAFQAVARILNVHSGSAASILNRTDVDRMLYAVNGTEAHLAWRMQHFPGAVQARGATLISVDAHQAYAVISYVVRFNDAGEASAQVGAVKSAYIAAHQYFQYDELVKAVETQPVSQLKVAVGIVG
jgi:hypothetical protein